MKLRTHRVSSHASALRLSLFVSLGLTPLLACGGSAVTQGNGEPSGAGAGTTNAGAGTDAGSVNGGSGAIGGGTGGTGIGGTGGTGGAIRIYCDNPVTEPATGLVKCSNGFQHRPLSHVCELPSAGSGGNAGGEAGAGVSGAAGAGAGAESSRFECTTDAQCSHLPLGYCAEQYGPGFYPIASRCSSGCLQDSDCGSSAICLCDGSSTGGKCLASSCTIDAQCGADSFCASIGQACTGLTFSCASARDECLSSSDCPNGSPCTLYNGRRTCNGAVCGRPFLVEEAPRFAEVTPRADWLDLSLSPDLCGLSPLQRAELAAHWSRLGQMEHASIAAFARFNLQLLALGAPADLVEACNQALVDETAHAKLCFAFASAYAGTKLGPSKLDMSHCFEAVSLVSVTKLVIAEGCIGETVAALEALEDADKATDPIVEHALLRIANDERNHAELAYRFVRWALQQCSDHDRNELMHEAEQRMVTVDAGQRIAIDVVVRPLLSASLCDS